MRAAGVFPRRMRHVPHFIDTREIPVKTAPGGGILLAGRLSPEKGIDVAIRAMGEIEGAVLDIAGTGPDEAPLRRLAELGRSGQGPLPRARRQGRGAAV